MMTGTVFFCLCMSPALDATVILAQWPTDGSIAKDIREVENVGGKGINVARWLAGRKRTVACGGLLGEDNAVPFEREFARYGISDRFVRVPGSTRRNEMFVTPAGSFKVNRAAFPSLPREKAVPNISDWGVKAGDVVVLSGSLPKACGDDFYARSTASLKACGATVVLDASGEALRRAVLSDDPMERPHIIKPNADECEALVGFVPKTPDEFLSITERLREFVPYPIISDGGVGCWFNGFFVAAPHVEVIDTTAAGDTLLAEWCHRIFAEDNADFTADPTTAPHLTEAARWAVAAGSAACTMPGGAPPTAELVARIFKDAAV